MFGPFIRARVKESHKIASQRIKTRKVRTFAVVASVAGECKVVGLIAASMLPGYNVLNMMDEAALVLPQEAVFTTMGRTLAHEFANAIIDHRLMFGWSDLVAFDFKIAMKSEALINASYSLRSSSVRVPSLARCASQSTLS